MVYGAASESALQKIDRLQYRVLHLCTGDINTIPINTVLVEAGEIPKLDLRREKLAHIGLS